MFLICLHTVNTRDVINCLLLTRLSLAYSKLLQKKALTLLTSEGVSGKVNLVFTPQAL